MESLFLYLVQLPQWPMEQGISADSSASILGYSPPLELTIGFIDTFNLFWNCSPLFKTDGVHPNRLGSRMLAANLQHTVQSSPRDQLFTFHTPPPEPPSLSMMSAQSTTTTELQMSRVGQLNPIYCVLIY